MVETFTSAGCGGRTRHIVAVILFTAGSVAGAAAVGAAAGALGGLLGAPAWLLAAAAAIALIGALRELGIVRVRVPDLRRQVPERWRRTLPLPAWSTGYGLILGSGFGTYQPAATYWVVVASVAAIGDPVAGALCLAVFGLARGVMVVLPRRSLDPGAALHRAIRPVNALALGALAAALAPAAIAGAQLPPDPQPQGRFDPATTSGATAVTIGGPGGPSVVVQPSGGRAVTFPGAWMPAINGSALAYVDATGIRIVNWRTGAEIVRVDGPVDAPALSGHLMAYRRRGAAGSMRLEVRNLSSRATRLITRSGPGVDIGRPSLSGQLLAWHVSSGAGHRVLVRSLRTGRITVLDSGPRRYMPLSPVVGHGWIAWLRNDAEITRILVQRLAGGPTRVVATSLGPRHLFTTMALTPTTVYVTRWNLPTATGQVLRYRLPRR